MHAHRQIFLDRRLAPATALTCAAWINLKTHPTSFLRFVACVGYQVIPGSVSYAFCQTVMFNHARDRQVFKHKDAERTHELAAFLMRNILAPVCSPFMNTSDDLSSSGACRRSFFLSAQFPLRTRQVFLITTKETRGREGFTSRKGGKLLKTHINTDRSFRYIFLLCMLLLNREADKPLPGRGTAQRDDLDRSFHGTVEIDSNQPNLAQDKGVPIQFCSVPILRIGDTIIASFSLVG
jgi:hypothetical protein